LDDDTRPQKTSKKPAGNSPESAAHYVGGSACTAPTHDESYSERQTRNIREQAALRHWAEQHGLLSGFIPKNRFDGGEHSVDYDQRKDRFIKATLESIGFGYGTYLSSSGQQATAGEYLDRLALHNRIFHDDIRIECVVPRGASGMLSVVTSQQRISGEPAAVDQIDETMLAYGFEPFGDGIYFNSHESLLIHDMHPRNAVFSQGRAVPIDTSIQRVTPAFAAWVRANKQILRNQGMLR